MNLMVDIETFSTKPDALIIQIGAALEEYRGQEPADWPTFLVSLNTDTIPLPMEYDVSPETVKWWSQQSQEAKDSLTINREHSVAEMLDQFNWWLESYGFKPSSTGEPQIWANPPTFDLVILRNAYETELVDKPWHYRQERCCRTMWNLFGKSHSLMPPHSLTKHRADHDSVRQLCRVIGAIRHLADKKVWENNNNEVTSVSNKSKSGGIS